MLTLKGKNLGERHHEFNLKVNNAVDKKTNIDEINSEEELSDIDKIFRIDLASKYRNLHYILDTLKSGDSFYVTRALKCKWIYDNEYSNVFKPSYLHHNLFPYMSQRMKTKMLTTISIYLRNEDRLLCFYSYCVDSKLNKLATKFLIYTSQTFKLDLILSDDDFGSIDIAKYLKQFIGSSFPLAKAYVDKHLEKYRPSIIHQLQFLYMKCEEDYLAMLEKYVQVDSCTPNSVQRFGGRLSKAILKRHKSRFWEYPVLYVNKLDKSMLVRFLKREDVKQLATLLLPTMSSYFWSIDFYNSYKFILDLIPPTAIFSDVKEIFNCKYDRESFEMNIQFYNLKYYEMLTTEEQESWALLHIKREEELFGNGNDFIWYKFIGFDKALEGIKKYVYITPDNDRRSEIVNILIDSAKCQEDLIKLLKYYYERHVNESDEHKISFIDKLISQHDVFSFTEECWSLFDVLLYSINAYNSHNTYGHLKKYVMISMIYHIINNKDFSQDLKNFIEDERTFDVYHNMILSLSEERSTLLFKYWLGFHAVKLTVLLEKPRDAKLQEDIYDQVFFIWHMISCFNRDNNECPEIVLTYMKSNMGKYQSHLAFKKKFEAMTEEDFVRALKTNIEVAIENISKIKCNAYRWSFRLNRLFRKLKVYFANDVAKEYLQYFIDYLKFPNDNARDRQFRNIKLAVVGVFWLASEESKIMLLNRYAPTNPKINNEQIDNFLLQVQKAICRLSYQCRPPILFSGILKYITGDYVRFCLPMFNNFLSNQPIYHLIDFIYKLIDSPVSIQKHGLRLAFNCFNLENLITVVVSIWVRTKNVSIRSLLYKMLYTKMVNGDGATQKVLYDIIQIWTLELDHQDHEDVFELMASDDMPKEFRGMYIEASWKTVSKFSNKKVYLHRKIRVIYQIKRNIYLMNREFLRKLIIVEHIHIVSPENEIKIHYSSQEMEDLMKAKWNLIATYIVIKNNVPEILEENHQLVREILVKCFQGWSHQHKGIYTNRKFCSEFLNSIYTESSTRVGSYINVTPIYQTILEILQNWLGKEELYLSTWKLKLSIMSRIVIQEHYTMHVNCLQYSYPCLVEIAEAFANKVGELVEELVNRNEFRHSFYLEMAHVFKTVCETAARCMDECQKGFEILVSGCLSRMKLNETHILAIMLIPEDPPMNWEKRHENAVNMIKQYSSDEIQSYLYYKFTSDCKVRNIVY